MGLDDEPDVRLPRQRFGWSMQPLRPFELSAFFEAHYAGLLRLLMFLGIPRPDAEDVLQKASEDLVRRVREGQEITWPANYVKTAAVRFFLKDRARTRRDLWLIVAAPEDADASPGLAASVIEEKSLVMELLRRLPERQAEVLALAIDGLTSAEIARLLGRSASTIRSNLMQARRSLAPLVRQPRSTRPRAMSDGTEG
jgi:RNA polymerase sigma factor (sigma-70 family)